MLSSCARPGDEPARYGGEEFALVLPGADAADAAAVAERLRSAITACHELAFTVSVGVAAAPQHGRTGRELVAAADAALYAAKRAGKDQVSWPTRPSRPSAELPGGLPTGYSRAVPERLKVIKGFDPGAEIEIPDEGILFGREEPGIGKLGDDPRLSRRHARVMRNADGQLLLEDLGSSNGSFVNEERVRDYRLLVPGDRIRLGLTTLELVGDALPSQGDRTVVGSAAVPGDPPAAPAASPAPAARHALAGTR